MIIYEIYNIVNHKRYIGQTAIDFRQRIWAHSGSLRKNKHYNNHLQAAWNKYGEKSFQFNILSKTCIGLLDYMEQYYIKKYKTMDIKFGYNKTTGGHFNKSHSAEVRLKISKARIGKKSKYPAWNKGKKYKCRKLSEQSKLNISKAHYMNIKVMCVETGEIFRSITVAARHFKLTSWYIKESLRGKNAKRSLTFKYI
jgi:group I intron endonuclease